MGGSAQVQAHTHIHTRARTHIQAHTHTHLLHILCYFAWGDIYMHDLVLLPCQPHSRDAAIKALELDLAAAPKQERMDQLVRAH